MSAFKEVHGSAHFILSKRPLAKAKLGSELLISAKLIAGKRLEVLA